MRKRERASLREHRNEEGRGCTENVLPVPSPVPSLFPSLFAQQCTVSEHVILLFSRVCLPPTALPLPTFSGSFAISQACWGASCSRYLR